MKRELVRGKPYSFGGSINPHALQTEDDWSDSASRMPLAHAGQVPTATTVNFG
ncbi:hypothetical protein HYW67_02475 [Candidatus Parcubacteria bacterium]|nr:hypothetical protein [Candidatus Parcubacteria bacterium]